MNREVRARAGKNKCTNSNPNLTSQNKSIRDWFSDRIGIETNQCRYVIVLLRYMRAIDISIIPKMKRSH